MTEEKKIRTLSKLFEARESMRALFGDEYAEKIRPYQDIIKSVAEGRKESALSIALEMAGEIGGAPAILCLCAGLELTEQPKA